MCGIAGLLDPRTDTDPATLGSLAQAMAGELAHRGPDDCGTWSDPNARIALGHRRLSIVDLSPEGHQPMASASGRYVITYNGEIYNHGAIRDLLDAEGAALRWRGHSDTEVMLAAFERWGVGGALVRFVGMFAFAVWDRETRTLHLARDRMGEKPIYYGTVAGRFAFASELKALRALPGFANPVDREALALYLRFAYVPSPSSIYAGIGKLPPATRAEVRIGERGIVEVRSFRYWELASVARAGLAAPTSSDPVEARALLRARLEDAVRLQMLADVPVGAFLSGGIDSSLVVALMQRLSPSPVRTFTIGFTDPAFDEAPHAREVARHLGTDHTEVYVTGAEALDVIPRLPEIYDEPFADSSQIPTCLVSKVARSGVTVSLSGDAGDELFAGYERYVRTARLARIAPAARRTAGAVLRRLSPAGLGAVGRGLSAMMPRHSRFEHAADKLAKLAPVLGATDPRMLYEGLVTQWRGEDVPAKIGAGAARSGLVGRDFGTDLPFEHWMMRVDQETYLPDDILVKVDRAAMAVGLETRVPMLDHRLVEYAWSLPLDLKLRDGQGKHLLRALLADLVPRSLTERPKQGFAVPLASWLRGPLRGWAEDLLDERRLHEQGFLDASRVRERWREHLSGTRNAQDELWTVLCFQAWLAHAG